MNYLEVKQIAEQWCEELEINLYETWHHPYKPSGQNAMTIISVLWSLHTERHMSVAAMRLHFDRYVDAAKAGQRRGIVLSEDLWAAA